MAQQSKMYRITTSSGFDEISQFPSQELADAVMALISLAMDHAYTAGQEGLGPVKVAQNDDTNATIGLKCGGFRMVVVKTTWEEYPELQEEDEDGNSAS